MILDIHCNNGKGVRAAFLNGKDDKVALFTCLDVVVFDSPSRAREELAITFVTKLFMFFDVRDPSTYDSFVQAVVNGERIRIPEMRPLCCRNPVRLVPSPTAKPAQEHQ